MSKPSYRINAYNVEGPGHPPTMTCVMAFIPELRSTIGGRDMRATPSPPPCLLFPCSLSTIRDQSVESRNRSPTKVTRRSACHSERSEESLCVTEIPRSQSLP